MMKAWIGSMKTRWRVYAQDRRAVAAIVFAMALPMLVASAGIAVDLSTAYNAKVRLGQALDKATLAAASFTGTDAQIKQMMQNFFYANYPATKYGTPHDVNLTIEGSIMTATAYTRVPTTFMSMFGIDNVDVYGTSQVVRELAGVEAVLVLDVTGSMAGNNIAALKTASTNFINTMFSKITDVQYIKIGIVPWSDAVNVGSYGKGKTPGGANYGSIFVDNPTSDPYTATPASIQYGSGTYDWGGCVLERDAASALTDTWPPNWKMYRYPSGSCKAYNCTGYNCAAYNCLAYQCAAYNCTKTNKQGQCTQHGNTCVQYGTTCQTYGNTCVQQGNTCVSWGNTCVSWSNSPNTNCPTSPILPMTNDKAALQNKINTLPTQGNTYSNLGMVWGWRVISPDAPFSEAAPYDDPKWSKTVILMTDGDNTINNVYSGEGPAGCTGCSTTVTQQNNKFLQVCTNMKAKGIRIYTITFQSAINSTTKSFYRNCATTSAMYFDAPSNQNLIDAFASIANQLSQLHLTK